MLSKRKLTFFFVLGFSFATISCHKTQNTSWPRIKRGYAALEQMYGVSSLKRNRFTSMAVKAGDKVAARNEFIEMGADWDKDIWRSSEKLENAKSWAMRE